MRNVPTNSDDVIDSRDIIARIEELESEREALDEAHTEALDAFMAVPGGEEFDDARVDAEEAFRDALKALQEWDNDNLAELETLQSLASQAEGYSQDWRHGATLIRDSYFKEYAQELADDIGAIDRDAKWPCSCIDWDQAARELQMDYTSVEFDGITYWVR